MRKSAGLALPDGIALARRGPAQSADGMFASGAVGGSARRAGTPRPRRPTRRSTSPISRPTPSSSAPTRRSAGRRDEFRKWAHPYFAKGKAWSFKAVVALDLLRARPHGRVVRRGPRHAEHGTVPRLRRARRDVRRHGRSRSTTCRSRFPTTCRRVREADRAKTPRRRRRRLMRRILVGRLLALLASLGAAPPGAPAAGGSRLHAAAPSTRSTARAAGPRRSPSRAAASSSWDRTRPRSPGSARRRRSSTSAGKMLLPAFHDSHVHPISGGMEALECDLHGLATAGRGPREGRRATPPRIPRRSGSGAAAGT